MRERDEWEFIEVEDSENKEMVHLQAGGYPINREYGVAMDFFVSKDVADRIREMEHTLNSMAGTSRVYAETYYEVLDLNTVKLYCNGAEVVIYAPELVMRALYTRSESLEMYFKHRGLFRVVE